MDGWKRIGQYVGVAVQDNTAQNQAQFQTRVKLLKQYMQTFLVKMIVGTLITQTRKFDDCK